MFEFRERLVNRAVSSLALISAAPFQPQPPEAFSAIFAEFRCLNYSNPAFPRLESGINYTFWMEEVYHLILDLTDLVDARHCNLLSLNDNDNGHG
ncbi:hypothetical protein CEXT_414831 [Caerostris extrusa]|uniref:Uncharacterized protein n=1 Tax=Caerostris extrusa TaxID=172846 RepID=A0AAV4RT04_CAEEX|nr:hypothetical protein CEXT_414831 [Caerostris extrusa]